MKNLLFIFLIIQLTFVDEIQSQEKEINWITFEQLDDSLKVKPKKTFIFFYAKWCSYCKKMERTAFKNDKIISVLNRDFYKVKMDAETNKKIDFDGVTYINKNIGKSRKPTHQIPLLLASRKGVSFSLPATLILDENFKVENRFFEYLSPKKLQNILEH